MPEPVRVRIIPGAVGSNYSRALVLVQGAGQPSVTVLDRRAATETPASILPLPLSQRLSSYMQGIRPFIAWTAGLPSNAELAWICQVGGGRAEPVPFRTLSGLEELTIVVASCYYNEFNTSGRYLAALKRPPAKGAGLKILMGDNLYLDVSPYRFADDQDPPYSEAAGLYLRHFWGLGYGDVLSTLPTVTTWDDHEFWNNFPEKQFWLRRSTASYRSDHIDAATECLAVFQATLNPDGETGVPPVVPPRPASFRLDLSPMIDIFAADVRASRDTYDGAETQMMTGADMDRLERWAAEMKCPGVLILGQPLWMKRGGGFDYSPPNYERQYVRIWQALADAPFDILVLSGDVHHTRLLQLEFPGNRVVHEFVSSPAAHIPTTGSILIGRYSAQGRGEVKFPTAFPELRETQMSPKPILVDYAFGTDAPNTIGTCSFRRRSDGAVELALSAVDLDTGMPARCTDSRTGVFKRRAASEPRCEAQGIKLKKRRAPE